MLRAQFGGRSDISRPVPLLEPTTVAGSYQQAIADAGVNPPVHNSVTLSINSNVNLLTFVEIAVGSDMKEWRVIRERAPIYVLDQEGRGRNTLVSYPDSASRYVRIRILDGTSPYTLTEVTLGYAQSAAAERVVVGTRLTPSRSRGNVRASVWTSDGDLSAFPISAVAFTSSQRGFSRNVVVEASDDGDRWRYVGTDTIQVPAQGGAVRLTADRFSETYARRWRITVNNGNDEAIADLVPTLLTVPRRVVFRAESGQSYRLLYGQPRAQMPHYDLSRLTDTRMIERAAPATLGAQEENGAWIDPTPWTERYDAVLWVALAAAALLLAVAAARALRAPAAADAV
jgi:hypothetical protein